MDSRKPLTAGEIEELKQLCANYANPACGVVEADVWKAFNALPRLLYTLTQAQAEADILSRVIDVMGYSGSYQLIPERLAALLTLPTDAAVREAVERLTFGMAQDFVPLTADIEVIIRAVQPPRLTTAQVKEAYLDGYEDGNEDGRALTGCRNVCEHTPRYDPNTAWAKSDTRAAFPEAFAVEVVK